MVNDTLRIDRFANLVQPDDRTTEERKMGNSSLFHWIIVLGAVTLLFAVFGYPVSRILKRLGFSRWWTLVAFIPYVNVAALWVFAFIRWPITQKPTSQKLES